MLTNPAIKNICIQDGELNISLSVMWKYYERQINKFINWSIEQKGYLKYRELIEYRKQIESDQRQYEYISIFMTFFEISLGFLKICQNGVL